MTTKTFSSRADSEKLAYADAVARQQFGMSFGQYCGSLLVDAVQQGIELPEPNAQSPDSVKADAVARIKSIATSSYDEDSGSSSSRGIRDLFARRYG